MSPTSLGNIIKSRNTPTFPQFLRCNRESKIFLTNFLTNILLCSKMFFDQREAGVALAQGATMAEISAGSQTGSTHRTWSEARADSPGNPFRAHLGTEPTGHAQGQNDIWFPITHPTPSNQHTACRSNFRLSSRDHFSFFKKRIVIFYLLDAVATITHIPSKGGK